jgi:hypothetical protein
MALVWKDRRYASARGVEHSIDRPDPTTAEDVAAFVRQLQLLKVGAGDAQAPQRAMSTPETPQTNGSTVANSTYHEEQRSERRAKPSQSGYHHLLLFGPSRVQLAAGHQATVGGGLDR